MKTIRYLFSFVISFVFCFFRRIAGSHISVNFINFVSPFAHLQTLGKMARIRIGYRSAVSSHSVVLADNGTVSIGERCFINRNCMIVAHDSIVIGNNVTIGPNTCIYDHDHDGNGGFVFSEIQIDEGTWIGAGCIILKGVHIGKNCIIGAGSLVTKDVPDSNIVIQKRNTCYIERNK